VTPKHVEQILSGVLSRFAIRRRDDVIRAAVGQRIIELSQCSIDCCGYTQEADGGTGMVERITQED
jgi:hypothetical protein